MSRWRLAVLWAAVAAVFAAPVVFVASVWSTPSVAPVAAAPVATPAPVVAVPPDYGPWAERVGAATGIPGRAVVAYARAELALPACGLNWATLAGVASVESDHGRFGGRVLTGSGRSDRPIVGVPLDGSPGVAAIQDTDGGVLDGDPVWDRAVGPLQFIPSTWRQWSVDADGDGDGVADPQDLDDAALAAGRYLCAGGDLSTRDGWRAAVLSYNASAAYVEAVLAATNAYAAASHLA